MKLFHRFALFVSCGCTAFALLPGASSVRLDFCAQASAICKLSDMIDIYSHTMTTQTKSRILFVLSSCVNKYQPVPFVNDASRNREAVRFG